MYEVGVSDITVCKVRNVWYVSDHQPSESDLSVEGSPDDGPDLRATSRHRSARPTGIASSTRFRTSTTMSSTRSRAGSREASPAPSTATARRKNEVGGKPYAHLFDGDAMLSQFMIDGRTDPLPQQVRAHHALPAGARCRQAADARLRPAAARAARSRTRFRQPANVANISVTYHSGQPARALGGRPPLAARPRHAGHDRRVRLRRRAEGRLRLLGPPDLGSAHRRALQLRDPVRAPHEAPHLPDRSRGKLHHLQAVDLPFATLNHDCALTRRYMVFVIDPLVAEACRASCSGSTASTSALRFDGKRPTQVILVPRDGGKPRIAECEAFFHYHINNAFEDGDDVVLDLVRYPDYDNIHRGFRELPGLGFDEHRHEAQPDCGSTPSDEVTIEDLYRTRCEFPQHDWRLTTSAHRYALHGRPGRRRRRRSARSSRSTTTRGAATRHEFGAGQVAGEPIFVPRSRGRRGGRRLAPVGRLLGGRAPLAPGRAGRARPRVRAGRGRAPAPPRAARLPRHVHAAASPRREGRHVPRDSCGGASAAPSQRAEPR